MHAGSSQLFMAAFTEINADLFLIGLLCMLRGLNNSTSYFCTSLNRSTFHLVKNPTRSHLNQ
jgi:hypothetical protein